MVGLLLILAIVYARAEPQFASDERLRSEIEEAAKDSRQLADDLAGMLARLEQEQFREEEAEIIVDEENAEIEEALKEMITRIENLAVATEEKSLNRATDIVAEEREQEEELHETLIELENVAKEIEFVAATTDKKSDTAAIENMAKILQDVSERIKGVEESTRKSQKASKTAKNKKLDQLNDADNIEEAIKNAKFGDLITNFFKNSPKVKKLKGETKSDLIKQSGADDAEVEELLESLRLNNDAVAADDDDDDVEDGAEDDIGRQRDQLPRRPKQLDDGFGEIDAEDVDDMPEDAKEGKSVGGGYKAAKSNAPVKEEPKETCEDKPQTNNVQVCTPGFKNRDSSLQFYTKKIVESQYCFNVTLTVCEERSQTVSKEVCTYEYTQKDVIAPARLAEIGYDRKLQTLSVTRCEKKVVKEGYKDKEVEVCYLEHVDVPYRLPTVTERIEDFVELSAPVPEKKCRLVKYDVPEVVCKDTVNKECVTLQSLDKDSVRGQVSEVIQDYRGSCEKRDLEQTTKVCTLEQKVKLPRYNQYNAYRG